MNLPGVVVDLPTLTAKDEVDLVQWGIPNEVDFIAASFVRKGSDLDYIRKARAPPALAPHAAVPFTGALLRRCETCSVLAACHPSLQHCALFVRTVEKLASCGARLGAK